jgi:hypothetical protein
VHNGATHFSESQAQTVNLSVVTGWADELLFVSRIIKAKETLLKRSMPASTPAV